MTYVVHADCFDFINTLEDSSVHLFLIDPPYYKIVKDSWDNQWRTPKDYVDWLYAVLEAIKPKMVQNGSIIFFGGIGRHKEHPFFNLLDRIEVNDLYYFRNLITWAKRRAYGTATDYLFCREEIAWYSVSPVKKNIIFNVPLTNTLRGYKGFKKNVITNTLKLYHHTTENESCTCMSSESQTQGKRDVLLLLRQMALLPKPQNKNTNTQQVVRKKQGTLERIQTKMGEVESNQEVSKPIESKSKENRSGIFIDRKRFEEYLDGHLPSFQYSNSITQKERKQFPVSGQNKQFCWVCTRKHLYNVLESQSIEIRRNSFGAGSCCEFHEDDNSYQEIMLTEHKVEYSAKSDYKRVSNVFFDINELFSPERYTQKPLPLMDRLIKTHSNPGDLVVDCFAGFSSTGISALGLGRRFLGCEKIEPDAIAGNQRCIEAHEKYAQSTNGEPKSREIHFSG